MIYNLEFWSEGKRQKGIFKPHPDSNQVQISNLKFQIFQSLQTLQTFNITNFTNFQLYKLKFNTPLYSESP
jgi:hypothetical protein